MIFRSFAGPGKNQTSRTETHTNPPQRSERVNVPVSNCLRALPLLGLLPRDPAGSSQAVVLKRRTAAFLWWGMQRWRGGEGAPRTLPMGWRSGTGHSETLFLSRLCWSCKAGPRSSSQRDSCSFSISPGGGQRAGGASARADPGAPFRQEPGWLGAAGSRGKRLWRSFFFLGLVSIKPPQTHTQPCSGCFLFTPR